MKKNYFGAVACALIFLATIACGETFKSFVSGWPAAHTPPSGSAVKVPVYQNDSSLRLLPLGDLWSAAPLVPIYSGGTAPASTFPFLFWMDTSSGSYLKIRNAADTGWATIGNFSGSTYFIGADSVLVGGYAPSMDPAASQIPVVNASGRLTIGVSDNGVDKFQVGGSGYFTDYVRGAGNLYAGNSWEKNTVYLAPAPSGPPVIQTQSICSPSSCDGNPIALAINPTSGNVLVGTSSDNSIDKFQVNGSGLFTTVNANSFAAKLNSGVYFTYGSQNITSHGGSLVLTPPGGYGVVVSSDDRYTNSGDIFQVNGNMQATQYRLPAMNTAPASASDTGKKGEIRFTKDFIFTCYSTNAWHRAASSAW